MNVLLIKERLQDNPDEIIRLLELSNFYHISYNPNRKEIRCARLPDTNKSSVMVKVDSLASICFSNGISGDIITLIQEHNDMSFVDTLLHIKTCLKIEDRAVFSKPTYIFGGYYKKVSNYKPNSDDVVTYPESVLEQYSRRPNVRFFRDNISIPTQIKYGIGYDVVTGRITVPWRSPNGEIVGIMGRHNGEVGNEDVQKWLPVIEFKKSQALFGFSENYLSLAKNGVAYIFESEKSVMQLDTYGIRCGLATGGSYVSDVQAKFIKSLPVSKIVLCYDEGLDEEHVDIQARKLISPSFFNKQVSYIFDKDNKVLPKGSKCSPSDLGYMKFKEALNKCEVLVYDGEKEVGDAV